SRRPHTRSKRDWSSDVCSSDLKLIQRIERGNSSSAFFETSTKTNSNKVSKASEQVYKDIIVNCFRYLNCKTVYEINTMSFFEYEARMYAYRLSEVDKMNDMHLQAWVHQKAKAKNDKGKSVYKTYKDFFDYEKEVKKIEHKQLDKRKKRLANIARLANERR